MDAAIGFLFVSLTLLGWGVGGCLIWKSRGRIQKWLNTPSAPERPIRRTQVIRRLEDLQAELNDLDKAEAESINNIEE
jgi:hypothetical protein